MKLYKAVQKITDVELKSLEPLKCVQIEQFLLDHHHYHHLLALTAWIFHTLSFHHFLSSIVPSWSSKYSLCPHRDDVNKF